MHNLLLLSCVITGIISLVTIMVWLICPWKIRLTGIPFLPESPFEVLDIDPGLFEDPDQGPLL